MEFREVIRRRHMTRTYDPRPLEVEVLDRILDAARRAPSAGFAQGVTFLVLSSASERVRFWARVIAAEPRVGGRWDRIRGAPVIVLPLADPAVYLARYAEPDKAGLGLESQEAWTVPYWDVDAAFATMAMLLAAADEGVGSLFFAIGNGCADLLADLEVPARVRSIGAVSLGYPAAHDPLSPSLARGRRPYTETIHWGHWGSRERGA